jgi:tetratricopeptide (TPR) repeat protein
VSVLATSRAPLRLAAERVVPLGSLPDDAAMALLRQRARVAGAPEDDDDAAVRELCARLDGLPLAIELIAPRLRLLAPSDLVRRLSSLVHARSDAVDRPERQRSVRRTVEWTVDLMGGEAQALFRRLAVFEGAAPVDVIEAVCGPDLDVVEALMVLLDYSLVQRGTEGFGLVTAVREVASALLLESGEADDVRGSHAATLAELGERVDAYTATREDNRTARTLDADAWSATEWTRDHDPELYRRLVLGFARSWGLRGQLRRALEEVTRALGGESVPAAERGRLLRSRAYLLVLAENGPEAEAAAVAAMAQARDGGPEDRAKGYLVYSQVMQVRGLVAAAVEAAQAAVGYFRDLGDAPGLVRGLFEVAQTQALAGNLVKAGEAVEEAARLVDPKHYQQALQVTAHRADLAFERGDLHEAIELNAQTLDVEHNYNAWSIATMTNAFSRLGDDAATLELGAIAEAMASEMGTDVRALTQIGDAVPQAMARARARLAADVAAAAERAGREVPAGQRLVRARELAARATAATADRGR